MSTTRFAVSIIIEWYNVTHAELSRATRMLTALKSQAIFLYRDVGDSVRLAPPLDLIIVFDSDHFEEAQIRQLIDGVIGDCECLTLRYLPASGQIIANRKTPGQPLRREKSSFFGQRFDP